MSLIIIRTAVRTRFFLTSRERASRQIQSSCDDYLALTKLITPDCGRRPILVPCMLGIDEDMRQWSYYMVLEHHAIVNRSITSVIESLVRDEEPTGIGAIDPKRDVMPSNNPGEEKIEAFRSSVENHLKVVAGLSPLRGTRTKRHPIFGEFDAHYRHCMFAFHLLVHYKQAKYVIQKICSAQYTGSNVNHHV
jgi:hypothetical protein